jgi:hypothetical protein
VLLLEEARKLLALLAARFLSRTAGGHTARARR